MNERYIYGELNKQLERAKPISLTLEITSDEWDSSNQVIVPVDGVNRESLVVCFYPTIGTMQDTIDNMDVYSKMGILCMGVSSGTITIERKDAVDSTVSVGVWIWL